MVLGETRNKLNLISAKTSEILTRGKNKTTKPLNTLRRTNKLIQIACKIGCQVKPGYFLSLSSGFIVYQYLYLTMEALIAKYSIFLIIVTDG